MTAVRGGSSLVVTWPEAERADSYHVTYTAANNISWQLAEAATTYTLLVINGLELSKTYIVGVRAKNEAGYSGWVNSAQATPPALSAANATVAEPGAGATASLDFVVSLNPAATAVRVDYTATSGTLSPSSRGRPRRRSPCPCCTMPTTRGARP